MAFYARNFIFDDVPSETFGLIISSVDSGESQSNASLDVEIKSQQIFRRAVPYFYGVSQAPVLEFEAYVSTTEGEITAVDSALIQKWLFGQPTYKKLRIVQFDMEDIYFNCFLTNPQIKRVGNIIVGYSFTVKCDSPYARGNPRTVSYTQSGTYILFNESDNAYYTYPTLTIQMDGLANGAFSIKNITDNNRTFSMGGDDNIWLQPSDLITVDNDLEIVTATLTPNILSTINAPITFFRLVNGVNQLQILGNITNVDITYSPLKKAG